MQRNVNVLELRESERRTFHEVNASQWLRFRALAIIIAGSSPAYDRKVDLADRGSQVFLRR
jgi:hypothetical protein